MRRSHTSRLLLLLGASGSSVIFPATAAIAQSAVPAEPQAEQTDGKTADQPDDIVIVGRTFYRPIEASSSTKFDLSLVETPQAISVITEDMISSLGLTSIGGAADYAAGFVSQGKASPGLFIGTFRARGILLSRYRGFKLNDYPYGIAGVPDTVGVERIEFPKGPTSIIYGFGNYGGIVNIITRKPQREFGGSATLLLGSYDFRRAELDLTGPLFADGAVRGRIGAGYEDTNSFRKGEYSKTRVLAPSLVADLGERTQLEFFGYYQKTSGVTGGGLPVFVDANRNVHLPTAVSRKLFNGNPDVSKTTLDVKSAVVALKQQVFDDGSLKLVVNGTTSDQDLKSVYSGYVPASFETGEATVYAIDDDEDAKSASVELSYLDQFEAFGQEHQIYTVAGYDYFKSSNNESGNCIGFVNLYKADFSQFTGPFPTHQDYLNGDFCYTGVGSQKQTGYNVGSQLLLRLTDSLKLLVGGRYDWLKLENSLYPGRPDASRASLNTEEFSYRASILYSVTGNVNAYLHYARGFTPQLGIKRGGGTVGSEHGTQYEIGVKGEFLDRRLGLSAALFQLDRSGTAISDPLNGPGDRFVIGGGKDRFKGGEIELVGQLGRGLSILANYAYVTAKVRASDTPSFIGQNLPVGPQHTASALVNYSFQPESALSGLEVGAGVNYVGRSRPMLDPPGPVQSYTLPSYVVVDARTSYAITKQLQVQLNIMNLFDKRYFTSGQNRYILDYGTPRSFRVSLDYKF